MNLDEHTHGLYSIKTDLDIKSLKQSCQDMQLIVNSISNRTNISLDGQTTLTEKIFYKYNFLMYPLPCIHDLFFEIRKCFHAATQKYFNNQYKEKHFIQCWMNVYNKNNFIDWHHHDWNINRPETPRAWHGFFCVDVEPNSKTSYKWKGIEETIDIQSKNGLMVMGISNGDVHKSSLWNEDYPRITIAFDIVPEKHIFYDNGKTNLAQFMTNRNSPKEIVDGFTNHWIPI